MPYDEKLVNDPRGGMPRLIEVMRALRDPDTGCPWDIEQDFASIAPYSIEESYEVADAIEVISSSNTEIEADDFIEHGLNSLCDDLWKSDEFDEYFVVLRPSTATTTTTPPPHHRLPPLPLKMPLSSNWLSLPMATRSWRSQQTATACGRHPLTCSKTDQSGSASNTRHCTNP